MTGPADRPRGWAGAHTPAARPATPYRPGDVIRDLVTLLRGHGLGRLYWSACAVLAVVSVTPGLTVWCDGQRLTCRYQGTQTAWPVASTDQAARDLATLARTPTPKENPDDPHSAA
ncbi:MAG TPA: hypothetical protein VGM53_21955 [Streptosporangiaceae bacterium]|jgi:hypothetical protein